MGRGTTVELKKVFYAKKVSGQLQACPANFYRQDFYNLAKIGWTLAKIGQPCFSCKMTF
jgi:hypothetical protein